MTKNTRQTVIAIVAILVTFSAFLCYTFGFGWYKVEVDVHKELQSGYIKTFIWHNGEIVYYNSVFSIPLGKISLYKEREKHIADSLILIAKTHP